MARSTSTSRPRPRVRRRAPGQAKTKAEQCHAHLVPLMGHIHLSPFANDESAASDSVSEASSEYTRPVASQAPGRVRGADEDGAHRAS